MMKEISCVIVFWKGVDFFLSTKDTTTWKSLCDITFYCCFSCSCINTVRLVCARVYLTFFLVPNKNVLHLFMVVHAGLVQVTRSQVHHSSGVLFYFFAKLKIPGNISWWFFLLLFLSLSCFIYNHVYKAQLSSWDFPLLSYTIPLCILFFFFPLVVLSCTVRWSFQLYSCVILTSTFKVVFIRVQPVIEVGLHNYCGQVVVTQLFAANLDMWLGLLLG